MSSLIRPIVRYGPNRISVCSASAVKEIYGYNANIRKSDWILVFGLAFDVPNTFSLINNERHAFSRRVLNQAFAPSSIKVLQEKIIRVTDILCGVLLGNEEKGEQGWSTAMNVSDWFGYANSDIINDLCYSRHFNMLRREEHRDLPEVFKDGAGAVSIGGYMPWILKMKSDWTFLRNYVRGARRFNEVIQEQSGIRLEAERKGEAHGDIFAMLREAKDQETGSGFTIPEIISETGLLTIAGSDTTRATLSGTVFYLLHNPPTYHRLLTELTGTFQTLADIQYGPKLHSCVYLHACIDETLRLSPPVGGILPRQVLPGGALIESHLFAEGTDVGTPIYALHHDARYFPSPFTFNPSRWLPGEGASDTEIALALSAFVPFGYGARTCAGRSLAYAEMMIMLARVVWGLEMRLSGGDGGRSRFQDEGRGREREGEFQVFDSVVAVHDGPMVEFRRRV